jgi:pyruvate/2-oxoglutarate dehydrogenase complex dihydrolipoamide acyltransferase (E2) component
MQNLPSDGAAAAAAPTDAAPATESRGAPAPADPPAVKAAALSPRARKAAAAKAVEKKPAKQPARKWVQDENGGFVYKREGPDLRADLRAFITARPSGWGHDDWIAFLDHLRERGHDTSDPETIGLALERERLAAALERIQGMGPRRVQAVVERYDTLWSACRAGVAELAELPGMNRALAEKVRQALN